MRKKFTTVLPDEPYKISTSKNITVECFYTGPRYLLVRMNKNDNTLFCVDRQAESLEEIEKFKMTDEQQAYDGTYQVVLDAELNTWEAAHLTHEYEHEAFDDYREVLSTGEVYEYHYDDYTGALDQPFYTNDIKYSPQTKTWVRPRYRSHALTRDQFMESVNTSASVYQQAYDSGAYPQERLNEIKQHLDFLKGVPKKYANVDHWKIPYPNPPAL